MKKKIQYLFIFLVLLQSCSNKKKYEYNLISSKVIQLPKEDYFLISSSCIEYNENKYGDFLYYLTNNVTTNSNEIIVFDLNNRKIQKKIIFDVKNGFTSTIHGFSILDNKTFICSNINENIFYLTDFNGKIIKKIPYDYIDKKTGQEIFKLFSRNEKPIKKINNKLYFSPTLYTSLTEKEKELSLLFSFDLTKDKLVNLNLMFPKNYVNSDFFDPNYSYCFANEKIVFSFNNSNKIIVYDTKNQKSKELNVQSDNLRSFHKKTSVQEIKMKDALYNTVTYSSFTEIIYDKYRNVYYRFFYPGIEIDKTDDNLASKANHFEKMSILILDEKLNKIGETFFDNKLRFYSNFITKEGLFVCSNLPQEKSENIKYTLLELKKNQ
ncbi:DUF4221 family protein [Flavobacterium macrobrachii]|uniref:DUF4221 family protein n=1 Tax=Flavobacterium macrobrachii TaxID=591204 RepID=A0ABS2CUS5_9FLAO|nr:DUF4221 family protein [Flavobacterium macrobrachii]MBM6498725.1 DUF4221 family protein [Flavobacterium macrobrachii]